MANPSNRFFTICDEKSNPSAAREYFQLRYHALVEQRGWELQSNGPHERDEFDHADCFYCLYYLDGQIVGGFRATRSDYPNLLTGKFRRLITNSDVPRTRDMLEISRFVIAPGVPPFGVSQALYSMMLRICFASQANSLVAMTDLRHERLLGMLGIPTRRFGHPQEIQTDRNGRPVVAVAGEIRLADLSGPKFARLLKISEQMEIRYEVVPARRNVIPARSVGAVEKVAFG